MVTVSVDTGDAQLVGNESAGHTNQVTGIAVGEGTIATVGFDDKIREITPNGYV